jgi:hypothetical protein
MTFVREEENGNNGHHAGGVWRGGLCPSFLDTRAGALARVGLIDRREKVFSVHFSGAIALLGDSGTNESSEGQNGDNPRFRGVGPLIAWLDRFSEASRRR